MKPIYLTRYVTATATDWEMVEGTAFPQKVGVIPDTYRGVRTGVRYPPHQVAEKVLTEELVGYVRASEKKTAFILAAGNTSFTGLRNSLGAWNPCEYKIFAMALTQVYAGKAASRFGAVDLVTTDSSACASSLKVLMDAQVLINCYGFERVIVLAVEDQVSEATQKFFGEVQATITKAQSDAGLLPSAFDTTNYGFNIAQGAVCAVFEAASTEGAIAMLGAGVSAEATENMMGQRQDGEGFVKATKMAQSLAGSTDIQVVKTHGTGTASNNLAERAAITQLLGGEGYVATAYKPRIGHTLGASGLLESCLLFDNIRSTGRIPAILNRTEVDSVFISRDVSAPAGDILSLAAGMGNIYAAAIWRL